MHVAHKKHNNGFGLIGNFNGRTSVKILQVAVSFIILFFVDNTVLFMVKTNIFQRGFC